MSRVTVAAIVGLIAAVPAGAAGVYFGRVPAAASVPCLATPTGAFRIADKTADYTVRIADATEHASLTMQIVDDPAAADFVLVDDGVAACPEAAKITTVHLDPAAMTPDMTVALTRGPADKKIYVNSARFSAEDGAALFAAIWKSSTRTVAARSLTR
jgi:hypothetical protein